MEFQEKNVLVFGSGKSGIAAAELLEKQNANIFIFEGNENQSVAEIKEKSESFARRSVCGIPSLMNTAYKSHNP